MVAERFPVLSSPVGDLFKGQTIEVGQVFYRRCATVGITEHGLYLEVNFPFPRGLNRCLYPGKWSKG